MRGKLTKSRAPADGDKGSSERIGASLGLVELAGLICGS